MKEIITLLFISYRMSKVTSKPLLNYNELGGAAYVVWKQGNQLQPNTLHKNGSDPLLILEIPCYECTNIL